MAAPVTHDATNVAQRTNTYAAAVMLKHAMPVEVLGKTSTPFRMPKNKADNVKFRRINTFTAATAPLVEGVTPTGRNFTYTDVTATLKQYGDFVRYTDWVADLHEDPVGANMSEQMGENIGRTLEALRWGVVKGGTSVFYANGSSPTDVNTPIALAKQRKVTRYLKAQKAEPFTRILSGSPDFNTSPVWASYLAVAHTDCEADIRNMPKFVPVAEYGSRSTVSDREVGSCEDVRYLLSPDLDPTPDGGGAKAGSGTTMVSTTGTSADLYPIIYFGKDAWHEIALRGEDAIGVMHQMPGKPSDTDPLGQRGFVSWKTYWTGKITNETWVSRLWTAVTDL